MIAAPGPRLLALLFAFGITTGHSEAQQVLPEGSPNVTIGGQPAARSGDGGAVGTSPDVFINGRPAVTAGDRTGCGGLVVGGSGNVFVNGRPLATQGSAVSPCPAR